MTEFTEAESKERMEGIEPPFLYWAISEYLFGNRMNMKFVEHLTFNHIVKLYEIALQVVPVCTQALHCSAVICRMAVVRVHNVRTRSATARSRFRSGLLDTYNLSTDNGCEAYSLSFHFTCKFLTKFTH